MWRKDKTNVQSSVKYIWKSKRIKEHWKRAELFDICICVIFYKGEFGQ